MITITECAAEQVRAFIREHGEAALAGHGLRVRIGGGGCDGFRHELELDDAPADDDATFEDRGIRILVDRTSLSLVEGMVIDYVETAEGAGFTVRCVGPPDSCGCGSTFQS